jgi:hypothetical protein
MNPPRVRKSHDWVTGALVDADFVSDLGCRGERPRTISENLDSKSVVQPSLCVAHLRHSGIALCVGSTRIYSVAKSELSPLFSLFRLRRYWALVQLLSFSCPFRGTVHVVSGIELLVGRRGTLVRSSYE